MISRLTTLWRDEEAGAGVDYGLLQALVGAVLIAAIGLLATIVGAIFDTIASSVGAGDVGL